MFERRREKVLLAAVLMVLAILVGDQLIVGPLMAHYAELDRRIRALEDDLHEANQLQRRAPEIERRFSYLEDRLHEAGEQFQNDFRKYLESRIGQGVEIRSTKQVGEMPLSGLTGMKALRFELELVGRLEKLTAALHNLDTSVELLRLENLRVTGTSGEGTSLTVRMTVSTVARGPKVR